MNEPLLLLPGMMCDARLFASQIAAFSMDLPVMRDEMKPNYLTDGPS
jgi:hypothetical protein